MHCEDLDEYIPRLHPSIFYNDFNRFAFNIIKKRHEGGKSRDKDSIASAFHLYDEYEEEDVSDYFEELPLPSTPNLAGHIDHVIDLSQRRKIKKISYDMIESAESAETPPPDSMNNAIASLTESMDTGVEVDSYSFKDCTNAILQELRARAERESAIYGLTTGFHELDVVTSGFQPGTLIIIAGRPAMGKTTIACNISDHIMMHGGKSLIFSLEMPKQELILRTWASIGGINQKELKSGNLSQKSQAQLAAAIEKTDIFNSVISDQDVDINKIKAKARKEHKISPLSVILIDYLQLIKLIYRSGGNKTDALGDVTGELKKLSKELGIPIIVLSQLSRKVEERQDKRPMNSDLRDSGAIEQDADIIMFVYRDEIYNPDTVDKGIAEIIIGKHRAGELATIKTKFEGQYSRFVSLSPNYDHNAIEHVAHSDMLELDVNSAESII